MILDYLELKQQNNLIFLMTESILNLRSAGILKN